MDHTGHASEKLQRVLMAGEDVFGGLAAGKLDIGHAAVTKDHDEEGEAAAGGPYLDESSTAPIDLGAFARGRRRG